MLSSRAMLGWAQAGSGSGLSWRSCCPRSPSAPGLVSSSPATSAIERSDWIASYAVPGMNFGLNFRRDRAAMFLIFSHQSAAQDPWYNSTDRIIVRKRTRIWPFRSRPIAAVPMLTSSGTRIGSTDLCRRPHHSLRQRAPTKVTKMVATPDRRMHPPLSESATVLLTNDDGFGAAGIEALQRSLASAGFRVIVVAPMTNHTAGSHRITMTGELMLKQMYADIYVCSGTPADCVRVGLLSEGFPPIDIVVSGLNHGANAGEDVLYSGTVAAAAEAALLGVPAIAFSQNGDGPEVPLIPVDPVNFPDAGYCAELVTSALDNPMPYRKLLSVNLPQGRLKSVTPAMVGHRNWEKARIDVASADRGRVAVRPWAGQPPAVFDEGTDFAALRDEQASISMLSVLGGLHDCLRGPGRVLATEYLSRLIDCASGRA